MERIAAGKGRLRDIEGIELQLNETAAEVETSMRELSGYRTLVRETWGRAAAEKLDNIIYGEFGKTKLRNMLSELVRSAKDLNPASEDAVTRAKALLERVANLNREITELHDMLVKHGA
jgi:hypothetical protein